MERKIFYVKIGVGLEQFSFGRLFFVLLLTMVCGACQKDEAFDVSEIGKPMLIRVLLPDPIVTAPMTRAGATDFDRITNLNIVVADKSGNIERIFYYDGNNTDTTDPTYSTIEGMLEVHFSKEYVQTHDLTSKSIFLIANYGNKLSSAQLKTVDELRALKQGSSDIPGVPNGCMMFAEAVGNGSHTHPDIGETGTSLEAQLVRTVAMVTVKIDGSELNKNIMITPTAISLHRVPTDCYIGKPNDDVVAGNNGRIAADGEFKDALQYSWDPIVGKKTQDGGYSEWRSHGTTTGGHYSKDNYNDQSISPLFLFENLHGENFGEPLTENDPQGGKRPAGTANNRDAIDKATPNCSYLQVDANYIKVDDHGNPQFSGKVSFRFFLGHDEYKNFDVTRNHYYQVTLALSGNGVTEGGQVGTDEDGNTILEANPDDVTWRVDSDLSTASFITGDINLNASGEYFYVHVAADPNVTWTVTGKGDQFVWCYGSVSGWTGWGSVAEGTKIEPIDNSGTLLFYCEPWMYQEGDVSQSLELTLTPSSGSPTSITITRYSPLRITLSVSDYPYIQEVFGKSKVDFLMDRIDRAALPWGFFGHVLEKNHVDGFDNTFHLIDENPDCGSNHRKEAEKYLPFGTADKTDPTQGGSAMIYALMLYENQNTTPSGNPSTGILQQDFPVIDRTQDWSNTKYYWTIPSIEEWQIIEKAARDKGILDNDFPILDWFRYWTSDAVTRLSEPKGGYSHAFTYQFNRGLDAITVEGEYPDDQRALRTDALRFRLISVAPDDLPPAN